MSAAPNTDSHSANMYSMQILNVLVIRLASCEAKIAQGFLMRPRDSIMFNGEHYHSPVPVKHQLGEFFEGNCSQR